MASTKVKIINKYAISMIVTAIVIEGVVVYFDGPDLTVNIFSVLFHILVLLCFACGCLLLLRFKAGLSMLKLLTPILFYRFYQRDERLSLWEITNSEEVASHFVR